MTPIEAIAHIHGQKILKLHRNKVSNNIKTIKKYHHNSFKKFFKIKDKKDGKYEKWLKLQQRIQRTKETLANSKLFQWFKKILMRVIIFGGLGFALYKFSGKFKEKFNKYFNPFKEFVSSSLWDVFDYFKGLFSNTIDFLLNLSFDLVKNFDKVIGYFATHLILTIFGNSIFEYFLDIRNKSFDELTGGKYKNLGEQIVNIFNRKEEAKKDINELDREIINENLNTEEGKKRIQQYNETRDKLYELKQSYKANIKNLENAYIESGKQHLLSSDFKKSKSLIKSYEQITKEQKSKIKKLEEKEQQQKAKLLESGYEFKLKTDEKYNPYEQAQQFYDKTNIENYKTGTNTPIRFAIETATKNVHIFKGVNLLKQPFLSFTKFQRNQVIKTDKKQREKIIETAEKRVEQDKKLKEIQQNYSQVQVDNVKKINEDYKELSNESNEKYKNELDDGIDYLEKTSNDSVKKMTKISDEIENDLKEKGDKTTLNQSSSIKPPREKFNSNIQEVENNNSFNFNQQSLNIVQNLTYTLESLKNKYQTKINYMNAAINIMNKKMDIVNG